jgi:hypothetical protein
MPRATRTSLLALAAIALILLAAVAVTATNVVPASRAGSSDEGAPTANDLKPSACSGLNLAGIRTGAGTFGDTGASNLVLGSPGVDTIRGNNGSDCILGGGGNDSLRGDGGTDVCIGGAGTDTFHSTCETRIQ